MKNILFHFLKNNGKTPFFSVKTGPLGGRGDTV
jgi:hypothetical protein